MLPATKLMPINKATVSPGPLLGKVFVLELALGFVGFGAPLLVLAEVVGCTAGCNGTADFAKNW